MKFTRKFYLLTFGTHICNISPNRSWINTELRNQTAQPSSAKQTMTILNSAPRLLIDQNDMFINIFNHIVDTSYVGDVLMLYITSLAKHNITPQHDISKMIIVDLVSRRKFDTLRSLIRYSLINESKPLACFLLSLSNAHPSVSQMAIDMLYKLNAETVCTIVRNVCNIIHMCNIISFKF